MKFDVGAAMNACVTAGADAPQEARLAAGCNAPFLARLRSSKRHSKGSTFAVL